MTDAGAEDNVFPSYVVVGMRVEFDLPEGKFRFIGRKSGISRGKNACFRGKNRRDHETKKARGSREKHAFSEEKSPLSEGKVVTWNGLLWIERNKR